MGNCLVTKLKESVANNALLKVGELRFGVNPAVDDLALKRINIYSQSGVHLSVISGGPLYDASGTSIGNEVDIPAMASGNTNVCAPYGGNTVISLIPKYGITGLNIVSVNSLDVSDLNYSEGFNFIYNTSITGSLEELVAHHPIIESIGYCYNIEGNISCFAGNTSVKILQFNNNKKITGNLSSLLGCTSLTTLDVRGSSVVSTQATVDALTTAGVSVQINQDQIISE